MKGVGFLIEDSVFNQTSPSDPSNTEDRVSQPPIYDQAKTKESLPPKVGDLESNIISLFNKKSPNYAYSFTGMRRVLGNIHQQSLSNSLDRLVEDSLLVKGPNGYYAIDHANNSRDAMQHGRVDSNWQESWYGRPLSPIPVKRVFQELHGKWFGNSRFIGGGYDKQNTEAVLEWLDTSGEKESGWTQLKIQPDEVYASFRSMDWIDRDKALEVFSRTFQANDSTVIFEQTKAYPAN